METVEIKDNNTKLRGAGLLATILLIGGLVLTYGVFVGVAFGANKLFFLLPALMILGSIGLFSRKKWSLYFITPTVLYWYFMYTTNGGRTGLFSKGRMFDSTFGMIGSPNTILAQKILIILIITPVVLGPIAALIYLWSGYKKLK